MTTVIDGCDLPDGQVHTMQTKDGVRGMNIPCTVSVSKGQATVEVNR